MMTSAKAYSIPDHLLGLLIQDNPDSSVHDDLSFQKSAEYYKAFPTTWLQSLWAPFSGLQPGHILASLTYPVLERCLASFGSNKYVELCSSVYLIPRCYSRFDATFYASSSSFTNPCFPHQTQWPMGHPPPPICCHATVQEWATTLLTQPRSIHLFISHLGHYAVLWCTLGLFGADTPFLLPVLVHCLL